MAMKGEERREEKRGKGKKGSMEGNGSMRRRMR
jgi:hypothetical protein